MTGTFLSYKPLCSEPVKHTQRRTVLFHECHLSELLMPKDTATASEFEARFYSLNFVVQRNVYFCKFLLKKCSQRPIFHL